MNQFKHVKSDYHQKLGLERKIKKLKIFIINNVNNLQDKYIL